MSQKGIGSSYKEAEELRKQHEQLELKCTVRFLPSHNVSFRVTKHGQQRFVVGTKWGLSFKTNKDLRQWETKNAVGKSLANVSAYNLTSLSARPREYESSSSYRTLRGTPRIWRRA